MNYDKNLINRLKIISRMILSHLSRYLYYINLGILIGLGIWFFLFVQDYYFAVQQDVEFIHNNISDVSYVKLNKADFEAVYMQYQKKIEVTPGKILEMKSPF